MKRLFIVTNLCILAILLVIIYLNPGSWWLFILFAPFWFVGVYDLIQKNHTILRNFPVIGHFRYLLESIGPEIRQYFVESDTDGKPIDRNRRAYIYQHAKQEVMTHPFGTELDVYKNGYEWMNHSMYPVEKMDKAPRLKVGGPDCLQPYYASVLNVSAMSFGSLSKNAVEAINLGAKAGGFYQNTGEGGISPYHLKGGDIVYQVGTGYFGCRTDDGGFDPEKFRMQSARPEVKMIELKLSQGAKPGHGGILPAKKNNEEIADIRGLKPYTIVLSPPGHKEFHDAEGLLHFIQKLRDISEGKPIGFKLCVGDREEFKKTCMKMVETGIKPDFITVDGGEGGTGAAPIDFSNYVGMPLEDGLIFVRDCLDGYGLKNDIRIIASGKVTTAYDMFRVMCFGADLCNAARAIMISVGCIQALKCNTNNCPTGVTTNDPELMQGLVVEKKYLRVKNYHQEVIEDFLELLCAAGIRDLNLLNRDRLHKRISDKRVLPFDKIYPHVKYGHYIDHPAE